MIDCYIKLLKTDSNGGFPIVTEIKKWDLNSVTTQNFKNNGGQNWKAEDNQIRIEYDPNPNIFYTVKVYMPDNLFSLNHISNVRSRFYYYDDTGVNISNSNQCGMRVKSIKNYTQTGSITSNKTIIYYDGKLLNRFNPVQIFSGWSPRSDCTFPNMDPFNGFTISSNDFGTNGGNLIGYGSVEEMEMAENINNNLGKKKYTYINLENQVSNGLPNIPFLKNGLISKDEFYDKAGNILMEKSYSYQNLLNQPTIYYGVKIKELIPDGYDFGGYALYDYYGQPPKPKRYQFNYYPLISEWNKLSSTQTNQIINGNHLITSEVYSYNDQGKTRSITTKNSNDEPLITKLYYSNDAISYNSPMSATMTGIPIYTEQYKGSELLSSQKTEYAIDAKDFATTNNLILPKRVLASKGINILEKRVTYDLYDNKGNLLQYTLENGTPVTIIWGYNQTLPIAKIENALYTSISTTIISDIQTKSNQDNDNCTTWPCTGKEETLRVALNSLRASLTNAMVTTSTYDPLIGITSNTDTKGYTTYYKYDAYGNLLNVKDKNGNILSENEYRYKN
jgi:YD repeat-containing protein